MFITQPGVIAGQCNIYTFGPVVVSDIDKNGKEIKYNRSYNKHSITVFKKRYAFFSSFYSRISVS